MSISKLRGKSALGHQHENTNAKTTATATAAGAATKGATTTTTTSKTATNTAQQQHGGATSTNKAPSNTTPATAINNNSSSGATQTTTSTTSSSKMFNSSTANVAAAAAANSNNNASQQQTYLPQTSLLKIEPFVPSFNTRLRRPIGRSYSTLSTTCLKRTPAGIVCDGKVASLALNPSTIEAIQQQQQPKATRPIHGQLRRHAAPKVQVVARQRSKSTSSSASNRPATAAAINGGNHTPTNSASSVATTNGGAIVTQQPNGICRIVRLPKEQEKLPDRINYDRRGLTAVPIFENEANLRLLSLQHNLINIFHIPKETPQPPETELPAKTDVDTNQGGSVGPGLNTALPSGGHFNRSTNVNHGNRTNGTRLALLLGSPNAANFNSSIGSFGSHSPTPPPLTTHPIPIASACNTHTNQFHKRNSLLQRNLNYNGPQLPSGGGVQATASTQQRLPQYHFAMKKSKSFVSNYSRHLNNVKRNLQKSYLTKTEANMIVATNLMSFDSGASSGLTTDSSSTLITSEMEEDDHLQQLEIKNKQLNASYGTIFQNLVFLDLYDNQIERIASLDGLPTLSVLLLGKNRITDISGLASLRDTLRVLDLHGNKITNISNKINCLQELKSLNLAGNQIRQINQNDFHGLLNLKELNLKRNKIKRINGFQHLTALERLWLCHNDLHKVEDFSSIAKAINILEVTIENNPVSLAGDCVSFLVSYLPSLKCLSQMQITDQVRRAAMAWRKNKEISDANYSHLSSDVFSSIRREEVISNARTNWELLRSQQTVQATLRNQRRPSPKQRELAKINESNEAVVGYEELQEFIKLPPIQQQQQQQQDIKQDNSARLSGSSGSSLGPNVDSSSSCYSSDNEEESPKLARHTRARVKKGQKPMAMRGRAIEAKEKSNKFELRNNQNSSHKPADMKETPNNGNPTDEARREEAITITTTPPECGDSVANRTDKTSESSNGAGATSQQLTPMNSNQTDNNSSILGISNASIIMLPPTERPAVTATSSTSTSSLLLRTATLTAGPSRATTPTTPITGNSSTLSLGFQQANNSATIATQHLASVAATTTTATTAPIPAPASSACKRYMPGSLMRSQTMVGNAGGGRGNNNNNNATAKTNAGLQMQSHQIGANGQAQASPSNVVSIVTAPPTTSGNNNNSNSRMTTTTSANLLTAGSTTTTTTMTTTTTTKPTATEREREQGGDYLIEICGRYLNIYGQGALRFIDKQWNPAKANDVHTLNFSYINFNNIIAVLARIKVRFPHAENFVFRETNIVCLGQLNALAELQGIASLFIDPEGNAITTKDLWRQYAVYRLSHWGLKLLNGTEVAEAEVDAANTMYAGLSDLVLWSMPDVMLQPLLARLRLDETCTASKMSPKEWLMKADNKSLRLVVGKEALLWKKSTGNGNNLGQSSSGGGAGGAQHMGDVTAAGGGGGGAAQLAALSTRERGKVHFSRMMENTCNAVEKLHKLETLWPSLLLDIVRNTLLDYSQLDVYLAKLMSEIMK